MDKKVRIIFFILLSVFVWIIGKKSVFNNLMKEREYE